MDFIPSNLSIENEYPKLVRDRIPGLIQAKGGNPKTRILNGQEFLEFLLKKMIEESTELVYSLQKGNTEEELADMFELIDELLELKGWSREDILKIQIEKRTKNGGFKKKILLEEKPE